MNNSVAVLVLFFNKLDQTVECVNSFLLSNQNVYILNNGSDRIQWKKLQLIFKDQKTVFFMDAGANLGVSGGRNFLIKATKEPWIFSVDNDIRVRPASDWLQRFENFVATHPGVNIVCPSIYNVHDNTWAQQLSINKKGNRVSIETGEIAVSNCYPGGASIVNRSIFEKHGLFDEEMFVGFEDYEYAIRAKLSGKGELKAFHCGNIELIHDHRMQKSNKDKEAVRQRYNEEKLNASYNRLVSKYNIEFDHEWEWWSRRQVNFMTTNKTISKIKGKIAKWIGR